ncbi:MAG TPA: hypothetical protein VHD33_01360, partial [Legionellaceae bacterium]|nr:hypothetical protein [Legionellaceae bacterium]
LQQFEYVLGFMSYASAQSDWYSVASLQAQSLQETMKQEFDTSADHIEMILHNYLNNYEVTIDPGLYDKIASLHFTIEQDLNAFADLERLKAY